jgi:hypothetical protein
MAITKIYPHVNVTTTAIVRPVLTGEDTGATSLFVPFLAKKGLSDGIQRIFSLSQFVAEYGQADYALQGRSILNIYNWLNAGGSIYALRLVGAGRGTATSKLLGTAANVTTFAVGQSIKIVSLGTSTTQALWNTLFGTTNVTYVVGSEGIVKTALVNTVDPVLTHDGTASLFGIEIVAKNKGTYYNTGNNVNTGLYLTLSKSIYGASFIDAKIQIDGLVVSTIYRIESIDDLERKLVASPYFGSVSFKGTYTFANLITAATSAAVNFLFSGGQDEISTLDTLVTSFFTTTTSGVFSASSTIASKLEYPIDMILDAGFAQTTKQAIADFTSELPLEGKAYSNKRSDITVLFDTFDFSGVNFKDGVDAPVTSTSLNHAEYSQKINISDVISGKDVWVTPTYFLASLIPANDRLFGIQFPTAGLTRGVLTGVKGIDKNPTEAEKTINYTNKINYIEKDSRGHYFMSQSTKEDQNTSLRFLNNVRVVNRMVRELENLGRDYLFEFNDTATLNNMRNALTRYVNNWIQNRTLNFGTVTVEKDEFSDERVNVGLNIRFTGTIEIISIDITIE